MENTYWLSFHLSYRIPLHFRGFEVGAVEDFIAMKRPLETVFRFSHLVRP